MVPVPIDFNKISDVIKMIDVDKNDVYDKSVKNVNAIDASGLVRKTDYDNKTTDIEGKTLTTTGLATTATSNAVKNEITNVSDIVKKTDYDAEISDIDVKYFTMSDYNKFTNDILDAKIKQNISKFIKNIGLDEKIKN